MNPIHLVIAPTFLTANDDRDVATFASGDYLRLAKLITRRRRGHSHVAPGYVLSRGLTSYMHYFAPA